MPSALSRTADDSQPVTATEVPTPAAPLPKPGKDPRSVTLDHAAEPEPEVTAPSTSEPAVLPKPGKDPRAVELSQEEE